MTQSIATIALLVRDYDEAIAYYAGTLGFELIEDTRISDTKRWVIVRPVNATGGRVFLFLETDDFDSDYENYTACGVRFVEKPRVETYGRVVVFEDIYGNRWDLLER
jgi:catechol 2,3-dioxygenase-like lactoylglutathione lyase family enzyme